MPLRLAIAALTLAAMAATTRAVDESKFPYRATINADDVYLRSGPGTNYYPVLRLKRGDVVEVYRHDPGGWMAIRPPAECFSWISGEFVRPGRGRMGEVIGDRVAARVGSEFSEIRDVIQVELDRGEIVEIRDAVEVGEGPAAQTWYKISPPPGEFRWVSGKFLDTAAREVRRRMSPRTNLLIARHRGADDEPDDRDDGRDAGDDASRDEPEAEPHEALDEEPRPPRGKRTLDEPTRPASRARRDAAEEDAEVDAKGRDDVDDRRRDANSRSDDDSASIDEEAPQDEPRQGWIRRGQTRPKSKATVEKSAPVRRPSTSEKLHRELEDMDLALSTIVVREPAEWDFETLHTRLDTLMDECDSALDRGRVRLLARKIERFEEIRDRHDKVLRTMAETDVKDRALMATRLDADRGARSTDDASRFDGTGRLTQVGSGDEGVAGYALVDSTGQVQSYLTPAPGVNLRAYVGRDVGVNGLMGYMPDQKTKHLTAKRVRALDDRLVR